MRSSTCTAPQLHSWGYLPALPSLEELATKEERAGQTDFDDSEAFVRALCGMQTHRGGEIWLDMGADTLSQRPILQGLDAGLWSWKTAISSSWKLCSEPISALEGRGFVLALKWRTRKVAHLNKLVIHLLDSQSCIGAFVKHRSRAHSMNFLCKRAAALELASCSQSILAFCRSHRNPADEPSRRYQSPQAKNAEKAKAEGAEEQ